MFIFRNLTKLLARGFNGIVFCLLIFVCSESIAQSREGQNITDAISLGNGKSVPIPQGIWKISKIKSVDVHRDGGLITYKYIFLTNSENKGPISNYLVITGELNTGSMPFSQITSFNWPRLAYGNSTSNVSMETYGTSDSSIVTKKSSSYLLIDQSNKISDATVGESLNLLGIDIHSVFKEQGAKTIALDNRVVLKMSFVRSIGFAIKPNDFEDRKDHFEVIKTWNKNTLERTYEAYFDKKPQELIYFAFEGSQSTTNSVGVAQLKELQVFKQQADSLKIEEARLKEQLAKEAKQQEEAMAAAQLSEQKRLAEAARIKDQLAKEAKQREEALSAAHLSEQKRLAEEAHTRDQLARLSSTAAQPSAAEKLVQLQLQMEALKAEIEKGEKAAVKPLVATTLRRALVIGNNKYLNVSPLENANDDALAMGESLRNLGFEVTVKTDLSLKDMNAAIRNFKNLIKKGDEVVFFYAGHGLQIGQSNFLLPIDITGESEDQIRDDAVLFDRVLEDIAEKKAKFTLAMLDACRDNPFKKSGRSLGGGSRGLAPASTANGQMIIFSAGAGQQALDKLGPNDKEKNGLFTRVFIKEMQKSGLSVDRVVRNVRSQVVELAKSVKHDQVPAIYDQVIGEFYFKP